MNPLALALVLLLAAAPASAKPVWRDYFNEPRYERAPAEVRRFVTRAQGCSHFAGEEGYDKDRIAELKRATDALCTGLDRQYPQLRRRYARQPAVLKLLEEGYCLVGPCISEATPTED